MASQLTAQPGQSECFWEEIITVESPVRVSKKYCRNTLKSTLIIRPRSISGLGDSARPATRSNSRFRRKFTSNRRERYLGIITGLFRALKRHNRLVKDQKFEHIRPRCQQHNKKTATPSTLS